MPENIFRRGKVWYARVQRNGQPYRPSLRTASKTEAKERVKELIGQLDHLAFYGENRHTWKEAVLEWSKQWESNKPATYKRYLVSLGQADPWLADKHVDEIDRKLVARIIRERKGLGATNATIRRDLTAISSVLRCCVSWGWRDDNPAKDFDRSIIRERRDPIREPTDAEVEAVIAKAPLGLGKMIRFADMTGCRQEEIAGLEQSEMNLSRDEVSLIKTKTNRPRTIRLTNPGCPDGVDTKVVTPPFLRSPYVFYHGKGERYHNVSSRFAAIVAGLVKAKKIKRFRFHDLRHRFAIRWLRNGGDIYQLSRHLGHTSVKTTEIYLGFVADESSQNTSHVQRSDAQKNTPADQSEAKSSKQSK